MNWSNRTLRYMVQNIASGLHNSSSVKTYKLILGINRIMHVKTVKLITKHIELGYLF